MKQLAQNEFWLAHLPSAQFDLETQLEPPSFRPKTARALEFAQPPPPWPPGSRAAP
jgi:hypothetical protein